MTEAAARLPDAEGRIPDEERAAGAEPYLALLARLSRQSVLKRYECYRDIDWDAPDSQIDPADPRFILGPDDPLGRSNWYQAQSPGLRARIGLYRVATFMRVGLQFENVLSRGLLAFALSRPTSSPEHRYAYHELIEESHHSMMFGEFVRRTAAEVTGLDGRWLFLGELVARLGRTFPELFFVFVLGGEDPIDHAQRQALDNGQVQHPLLRRISQVHITEEARHLCFARNFLKQHVPQLSPARRTTLALMGPVILRVMAWMMMRPPRELTAIFGVPAEVLAEAFAAPEQRAATVAALAKVRALFVEMGLITPYTEWLWHALGADAGTTTAGAGTAAGDRKATGEKRVASYEKATGDKKAESHRKATGDRKVASHRKVTGDANVASDGKVTGQGEAAGEGEVAAAQTRARA
jgi:hypothetical protein